jgi:hypothetical protein
MGGSAISHNLKGQKRSYFNQIPSKKLKKYALNRLWWLAKSVQLGK